MSTRICLFLVAGAIALLLIGAPLHAQGNVAIDRYAWQFPNVAGVSGADDLTVELREETDSILAHGHLAPLRLNYADVYYDGYFVYTEPGRIITTLAWAYPYLTPLQKSSVLAYVAAELSDGRFAPWGSFPSPLDVGARRERHPLQQVWNMTTYDRYRPVIHTIYGLWLYAYRTGDWTTIQGHWTDIKTFYSAHISDPTMYGTMCASVAMARLADHFNDTATRTKALADLQTQLNAGRDFSLIEQRARVGNDSTKAWAAPYGRFYDPRNTGLLYFGWVFLGSLSPEIGRYLQDYVAAPVITRHESGKTLFPFWWMMAAPYFTRWTGDEGVGLSPEIFGMIPPIERWVIHANSATLASPMRSAPTGIGDCYWLEALVQAIESTGTLTWIDVRSGTAVTLSAPAQQSPADGFSTTNQGVTFSWNAVTNATAYRIQVARDQYFGQSIADSTTGAATSLGVTGLLSGTAYYWRVNAISATATSDWSPARSLTVTGPTSVDEAVTPTVTRLESNYPNPFNPSTTIRYSLAQRSRVKLVVFDLLGREVAVLVNGEQERGNREMRFDASHLASGVYFYRLQAGSVTETRKLLLLK